MLRASSLILAIIKLMQRLKVLYFGTPDFSAEFLKKILDDKNIPIDIAGVVTQNDKKSGRKQEIKESPVKKLAKNKSINIYHDFSYGKFDLGLIFSYGKIIPKQEFEKFKFGIWVIHPSILPKYRGASPIANALISGDSETGVAIIQADEGVDTGDIVGQVKSLIKSDEKRDQLTLRLVDIAFVLFKNSIETFVKSDFKINLIKQRSNNFLVTKKLEREHGFVSIEGLRNAINKDGKKIYNLFRGLYPWPGIWTLVKIKGEDKRLKIIDMALQNNKIQIKKVQLEGKKIVDFETLNLVYKVFI